MSADHGTPWWVILVAAAMMPLAVAINGCIDRDIQREQHLSEIRLDFLDRALDSTESAHYRERVLVFLKTVLEPDDPLTLWADQQLSEVKEILRLRSELAEVESLLQGANAQLEVERAAAESLSERGEQLRASVDYLKIEVSALQAKLAAANRSAEISTLGIPTEYLSNPVAVANILMAHFRSYADVLSLSLTAPENNYGYLVLIPETERLIRLLRVLRVIDEDLHYARRMPLGFPRLLIKIYRLAFAHISAAENLGATGTRIRPLVDELDLEMTKICSARSDREQGSVGGALQGLLGDDTRVLLAKLKVIEEEGVWPKEVQGLCSGG